MRPDASDDRHHDPALFSSSGDPPGADDDATPTVAELRFPAADLALAAAFDRRPDLTVGVEQVATSRPRRPFSSVWVGGTDDVEDALGALDDADVVVRSVLTRRDDAALCDVQFPSRVSLVVDVITSRAGTVLSARASDGAWTLRVRYPTRETLAETVATLERFDVAPDLSQVGGKSGSPVADLTEKQRDAVAVALERGYFEIPREVSLKELAEDLDVTHQALSERLRRAEQALLRAEFGDPCLTE